MDTRNSRFWAFEIGFLLVLPIIFLILGFFAFPELDDFCYANSGRNGIWSPFVNHYFDWGGRYSANLALIALPQFFDLVRHYYLVPLFSIASLSVSAMLFASVLLDGRCFNRNGAILGLAFTCAYLAGLESIHEGLFWFAGTATYQWPLMFLLLNLASLHLVEIGKQRWAWIPLVVSALIGGGFSELVTIMAIPIVIAFFIAVKDTRLLRSRTLLINLGLWLLCLVILVSAPGNWNRKDLMPKYHEPAWVVFTYFFYVAERSITWLVRPTTLLLILSVFLVGTPEQLRSRLATCGRLKLGFFVLLPIGIVAVGSFPCFCVSEVEPPARAINSQYFCYLLTVIPAGLALVSRATAARTVPTSRLRPVVLLCFAAALFLPPTTSLTVLSDLRQGPAYRTAQRERVATILASKDADAPVAIIPPLQVKPKSLFGYELDYYSCTDSYFGIDVRVRTK